MTGAAVLPVLLGWGTLVGLDLVSFPQGLLSRPLVAATVAGALLGDLEAGLRVGLVLELFALDVLPIGASRYPDFGPGTVAATVLAAGRSWSEGLGPAVLLGLVLAMVGGRSIDVVRRINGRALRQSEASLLSGDVRAVTRLQWLGLTTDAARSLGLTLLGLLAVVGYRLVPAPAALARTLGLLVVAGGVVAGLHGVSRRSAGWRWIVLGLGLGGGIAWLA
ncbi:MAG: PTS sugar transporter subunit IIC [Gemmatimonadota bacterium]